MDVDLGMVRDEARSAVFKYFTGKPPEGIIENVLISSDEGKRLLKLLYEALGFNFSVRLSLNREVEGVRCKAAYPVYVELKEQAPKSRAVTVEHRIEYSKEARVSQAFESLAFSKLLELGYPGARLKGQTGEGATFGWIAIFIGPPYFSKRAEPGMPIYPVLEIDEPKGQLVERIWSAYLALSSFYVNGLLLTATTGTPEIHRTWGLLHDLRVLTLLYPENWNPNKPTVMGILAQEEKTRHLDNRESPLPAEIKKAIAPIKGKGPRLLLTHASKHINPTVKALFETMLELPFKPSFIKEGFSEKDLNTIYLAYVKACEHMTGSVPKVKLMEDYIALDGEAWLEGEPEIAFP